MSVLKKSFSFHVPNEPTVKHCLSNSKSVEQLLTVCQMFHSVTPCHLWNENIARKIMNIFSTNHAQFQQEKQIIQIHEHFVSNKANLSKKQTKSISEFQLLLTTLSVSETNFILVNDQLPLALTQNSSNKSFTCFGIDTSKQKLIAIDNIPTLHDVFVSVHSLCPAVDNFSVKCNKIASTSYSEVKHHKKSNKMESPLSKIQTVSEEHLFPVKDGKFLSNNLLECLCISIIHSSIKSAFEWTSKESMTIIDVCKNNLDENQHLKSRICLKDKYFRFQMKQSKMLHKNALKNKTMIMKSLNPNSRSIPACILSNGILAVGIMILKDKNKYSTFLLDSQRNSIVISCNFDTLYETYEFIIRNQKFQEISTFSLIELNIMPISKKTFQNSSTPTKLERENLQRSKNVPSITKKIQFENLPVSLQEYFKSQETKFQTKNKKKVIRLQILQKNKREN